MISKDAIKVLTKYKEMNQGNLWKIVLDAIDFAIQAIRERDAAIADLEEFASCDCCKHANSSCETYWNIGESGLDNLCHGERWEWRGVQNENR